MVRSTRTTALLVAVALTVALSGCAGVLDDGSSTETSMPEATSTDVPTDSATTAPTDGTDATTTSALNSTNTSSTGTTTEQMTTTGATASPTATPGNATAAFVEDGETLATVSLEIADNDSERAQGLMHRESLAENHGMVFVYGGEATRSFWMKNTLIPLDMVFVAANGTVLNVEHADVPPEGSSDYGSYVSDGPAQYVVEVNRGFANRTGVGPGTQVEFSGLDGED
ncbi:DUF192 domain-containing protein [Halomarina salina]|uniref:DUF192 domain-containing protein n=1 Tax=Halomarina salina TaxID=1872699 RepID=A0ABD5RM45_9EURY|nr:DUF192 domain-containing protein [Halomarina salina]